MQDSESEVEDICSALHELGEELSRKKQKSVHELETQPLPAVEENSLERHYQRYLEAWKEQFNAQPPLLW